jgi:hypothetical protein
MRIDYQSSESEPRRATSPETRLPSASSRTTGGGGLGPGPGPEPGPGLDLASSPDTIVIESDEKVCSRCGGLAPEGVAWLCDGGTCGVGAVAHLVPLSRPATAGHAKQS